MMAGGAVFFCVLLSAGRQQCLTAVWVSKRRSTRRQVDTSRHGRLTIGVSLSLRPLPLLGASLPLAMRAARIDAARLSASSAASRAHRASSCSFPAFMTRCHQSGSTVRTRCHQSGSTVRTRCHHAASTCHRRRQLIRNCHAHSVRRALFAWPDTQQPVLLQNAKHVS
jgi:hypothetical protein